MPSDENDVRREEINEVRLQEQKHTAPAKRDAAARTRALKRFSSAALKAKKAKDARAFAQQLYALNIREGSPEWNAVWKYFHS